MPEIKEKKPETLLEYLGKPFNIKSKVFDTQHSVNCAYFSPADVKTLEKKGFIKATPAYRDLLKKAEAEQDKENAAAK